MTQPSSPTRKPPASGAAQPRVPAYPPSRVYKALGDPLRLRLINLLAQRGPGICVCDLVDVLRVPQSTISRQIAPLRSLGLIRARRAGTWMLYGLEQSDDPFFRGILNSLDAAAASPELQADLQRFDDLKRRQELACCRPAMVEEAARLGDGIGCCAPAPDEAGTAPVNA
jgi:ArsR family transcriptional regulator, arsenate/arsenite/antimonite-responsive transcriptional repressor